ncbi:MAG: rRNA maturation RNase YbeY [Brucellaceae bacterium]|nr:rRNA maturation RNase YbeY [Brucellaceae bacterium]
MTEIDIAVTGGDWPPAQELERMAARAMEAVSAKLGIAGDRELSLLFCDDAEIRALNARWRNRDGATNVLSFPATDLVPGEEPGPLLGDIAVAFETVAREAALEGKSFDHHLTHLLVHGILHLLGYDHLEENEASVMEDLERAVLDELDISDPYAVSASEADD